MAGLLVGPAFAGATSPSLGATDCADAAAVSADAPYVPNDSGVVDAGGPVSGWTAVQWDLAGPFGINAPAAWSQASRLGGSGGRGVTVAVLDSGVAYADRGPYRRSPDLAAARVVRGYDFIDHDPYPNDEYGHGTLVASTIAATANNAYGTVGVAYRAAIMPLRVLDSDGLGCPATIARAIRYAVDHKADVINLSFELFDDAAAGPIPRSVTSSASIREALVKARRRGVVVVAAAGNSSDAHVPGSSTDRLVISVGATTEHGCLAGYSNHGPGMDLVAPGGGADANLPADPNCPPATPPGRDIPAVSFRPGTPSRFEMPPGVHGTSSAAPHVTGVVALMLACGVPGHHPTPGQIEQRLEQTARDLGPPGRDRYYGAGLVDAAAALGVRAAATVTSPG